MTLQIETFPEVKFIHDWSNKCVVLVGSDKSIGRSSIYKTTFNTGS